MSNPKPTGKGKILLVDDEAEFRGVLVPQIQAAGYECLEAGNAAEAIRLITDVEQSAGLEMVITDCKMPGGDGFELLNMIRLSDHSTLPVLIMSGALSYEQISEAATQKPVDILIKPFSVKVLLERISRLLGKPRGT